MSQIPREQWLRTAWFRIVLSRKMPLIAPIQFAPGSNADRTSRIIQDIVEMLAE